MWAGFASSVIERKWPPAAASSRGSNGKQASIGLKELGILFYRTRNADKAQSAPIVTPPPLPYGGETERENQCAMLADFITNYTG